MWGQCPGPTEAVETESTQGRLHPTNRLQRRLLRAKLDDTLWWRPVTLGDTLNPLLCGVSEVECLTAHLCSD